MDTNQPSESAFKFKIAFTLALTKLVKATQAKTPVTLDVDEAEALVIQGSRF